MRCVRSGIEVCDSQSYSPFQSNVHNEFLVSIRSFFLFWRNFFEVHSALLATPFTKKKQNKIHQGSGK